MSVCVKTPHGEICVDSSKVCVCHRGESTEVARHRVKDVSYTRGHRDDQHGMLILRLDDGVELHVRLLPADAPTVIAALRGEAHFVSDGDAGHGEEE